MDWPASPPTPVAPQWLKEARGLRLGGVPTSSSATAAVQEITIEVAQTIDGSRKNKRGLAGRKKLAAGVGAIVAGVLMHWAREEPRAAYRSLGKTDLVSPVAGDRMVRGALEGLVAAGFVSIAPGVRYKVEWGDGSSSHGKATRLWPAPLLLETVAAHGVTPDTFRDDFRFTIPLKPPKVPDPITLRPLRPPGRSRIAAQAIPIRYGHDTTAAALRAHVEAFNAFAAGVVVAGCEAPRFKRAYISTAAETGAETWSLGGRWVAVGAERAYQGMPAMGRREDIAIDGVPVVEIDVRASNLTLMHGLLGLALPDPLDLYDGFGLPRDVVKAWVSGTLGKGSPVRRWAPRAAENTPAVVSHHAAVVGAAVLTRYPFLEDPAGAVAEAAGLMAWPTVALRRRVLVHRLMAIEAEIVTAAMESMRAQGRLVLPVHDSLIVQGPWEPEAMQALEGAFMARVGIVPRLKVARPAMCMPQ